MAQRDTRRLDEDDVRHRPSRHGSRARSKQRPAHDNAASGMVVSVDRGRFGVLLNDSDVLLTTMRARELGRTAVVVGDQVSVVGVAGIGLRGLRGQPGLQLGLEPGRAGGQPHLGAERRQQRRALGRAEQLAGPVRIRLAPRPPPRRRCAAPRRGRDEIGQHARLQMAAHEHPRALPVAEGELEAMPLFDDPFLLAVPAGNPHPKS